MATLAPPRLDYASATGIDHLAWWCEQYAVQSIDQFAGQPLTLEPWQIDFMGEVAAVDEDEFPYWKTAVLVVPRKNGKTTMLGAYATYHLDTFDGAPEVLLTASSDKQAGRLFDAVTSFVRRSPYLLERSHIRDHVGEIARSDGGGKIIRMSSDPNRGHGYNPSRVIADELHAWTTPSLRKFWAAMTTAGGARRDNQTLVITTAGEAHTREDGILGRLIDGNEAAGEVERRGALTVSRNHEARVLVYNYSAETKDRHDLAAIRAANPASWITDDYLAQRAGDPGLSDAEFLQLHGCVWAEGAESFVSHEDWRATADGKPLEADREVCLGIDGSYSRDTTVVAWAGVAEDGRIDVDARIFAARPGVPHHVMHHGGTINFPDVEDFIVEQFGVYAVREAAFDPRFMLRSAEVINERLDEAVIIIVEPSSRHMRDALAAFYSGVVEGTIRHTGDPQIAAQVAACKADRDDRGWKVSKRNNRKPIDVVPAMAMAYWRAAQRVDDGVPLVAFA